MFNNFRYESQSTNDEKGQKVGSSTNRFSRYANNILISIKKLGQDIVKGIKYIGLFLGSLFALPLVIVGRGIRIIIPNMYVLLKMWFRGIIDMVDVVWRTITYPFQFIFLKLLNPLINHIINNDTFAVVAFFLLMIMIVIAVLLLRQ